MLVAEKIKTFFKEVWTETRKVDWPRRKETTNHTLLVIGISLVAAAFLGILDFIFLQILGKFVL